MTIKNKILKALTFIPKQKFESNCKHIEVSFQKTWGETAKLLFQKNTFWSNKGFNKKSKIDDFDITTYTDYEQAMRSGALSGLSPFNLEKVTFCLTTSGSSGSMKPFLMSESYQKQYQIIAAPFIHYMCKNVDYGKGKLLYLISLDSQDFNIQSNVPVGTIGNFTYKKIPQYLKNLYVLPSEILKNFETFKKEAPLYAIGSELSAIFSVTPPVAINFLSFVFDHDLKGKIESVLKQDNQRKYNVTKSRTKYLKSLLNKDSISVKDLWPNLQILSCWTSSICEVSVPRLRELIGETPIADGLYSATEGWVCVQTDSERKGSIYHPRGCLLEFIEQGQEIVKDNLIKPWQLKIGKRYEVFFTNKMGLIRYQIGDILECMDFFYQSPVLQFVSKNSNSLSLGMLRLSEEELIQAVNKIELKGLNFFFSTSQKKSALSLYAEFTSDNLAMSLDQALQEVSLDYKKERKSGTLEQVEVIKLSHSIHYNKSMTGQIKSKLIIPNYKD